MYHIISIFVPCSNCHWDWKGNLIRFFPFFLLSSAILWLFFWRWSVFLGSGGWRWAGLAEWVRSHSNPQHWARRRPHHWQRSLFLMLNYHANKFSKKWYHSDVYFLIAYCLVSLRLAFVTFADQQPLLSEPCWEVTVDCWLWQVEQKLSNIHHKVIKQYAPQIRQFRRDVTVTALNWLVV